MLVKELSSLTGNVSGVYFNFKKNFLAVTDKHRKKSALDGGLIQLLIVTKTLEAVVTSLKLKPNFIM